MALLVAPLGASLCAAGVCDPDVACPIPMRPTSDNDGLELRGPSCCLSLSTAIAEPEVATKAAGASVGLPAPALLAKSLVPAPPPALSAAQESTPSHAGRTTLTLHRTLLL